MKGERRLVAARLLSWYGRHGRDLPWRGTRNPYFVWVSEVMLQQTQVDTVIPYYHRFLTRFPTIESLAGASLEEVLKAWENLGYYARARPLHEAAREVVANRKGHMPRTWEEIVRLPGVGPYTAGAVLSIAFGQRVPALDGNVRRVLTRLLAIQKPLEQKGVLKGLREAAEELLPEKNAGRFNQALMDLGAVICTPKRPSCPVCPLEDLCLAFRKGVQETLPVTRKRGPVPHRQATAGIIYDEQVRMLILRRPGRGLLGGLWRFPGGEIGPGETPEEALKRAVRDELGARVSVGEKLTAVKHAYTHFRITLHVFRCNFEERSPSPFEDPDRRWVRLDELNRHPFSKVERKVMGALRLPPAPKTLK